LWPAIAETARHFGPRAGTFREQFTMKISLKLLDSRMKDNEERLHDYWEEKTTNDIYAASERVG
jgi:hypothetical protein